MEKPEVGLTGLGTYQRQRLAGLRQFLEDEIFREPATHYTISMGMIDHHFLIKGVRHYPAKKRVVIEMIHKGGGNRDEDPGQESGCVCVRLETMDFLYDQKYAVVNVNEDTSAGLLQALFSGKWNYVIPGENYPKTREEKEDAVRRAEKRVKETAYDLYKNCEYFVTEVLTGKGESKQFKGVVGSGILVSSRALGSIGSFGLPR